MLSWPSWPYLCLWPRSAAALCPVMLFSTSLTTCFVQYIGGFQAALLLQADAAQCLVCQQVWIQRLCYRREENLQAFARSLRSVQGLRSGKMVRCTVSGRLQARGPGCLPDVAVTVQLKNEGPYPISKSWVAILECKPSHEGGLSSPKLFILLAQPNCSALLLAQPEGIHVSHAWCSVSAAQQLAIACCRDGAQEHPHWQPGNRTGLAAHPAVHRTGLAQHGSLSVPVPPASAGAPLCSSVMCSMIPVLFQHRCSTPLHWHQMTAISPKSLPLSHLCGILLQLLHTAMVW